MKQETETKLAILAVVVLAITAMGSFFGASEKYALAGSGQIAKLANVGMAPELANQVDILYSSAVEASTIPKTDLAYDLGSATKEWRKLYAGNIALPVGTVVAAATPASTAPILASVPTVAANAGIFLVTTPVAGTLQIVRNNGGNTIKVYPDASATINGGSAGASVDLATLKTLICFSTGTTAWLCTWGQAS